MLRFIFLTLFFFVSFFSFTQQNYFQFWFETGVKGKIKKNIEYAVDWNNRFGNYNLQTTFGQASIKYKIKK